MLPEASIFNGGVLLANLLGGGLHLLDGHVVEHDDVNGMLQGFLNLVEGFCLDFNGNGVGNMATDGGNGGAETPGGEDVVVFNHDGVIEAHTMVLGTPNTGGIFF